MPLPINAPNNLHNEPTAQPILPHTEIPHLYLNNPLHHSHNPQIIRIPININIT